MKRFEPIAQKKNGVALLCCLGMVACAKSPANSGSSGGADPYANMTGNWQIAAKPTSGTAPFTALSGNFYEINVDAAAHQTTAALLAQSDGCFSTAGVLPLKGNVEEAAVKLSSFEVNGQILTLTATKDLAAQNFSGTYSIAGGCADGDTGTLVGTQIAAVNGTYSGPLAADTTRSIQLSVQQSDLGTSSGTYLLTGSGSFTGFKCVADAKVQVGDASSLSGSGLLLQLIGSSSAAATVTLHGEVAVDASTITLSSITIEGNGCSESYGSATLAKQANVSTNSGEPRRDSGSNAVKQEQHS